MVKSVSLDEVDRGLVHGLRIDGRVSSRRLAAVLGVSEHTVARRYRRLRSAGVIRVVGAVNGFRLGYTSWTIRLRCTPDAAGPIAAALADRDDTFWVHVLSGGTEISCNLQARDTRERDGFLLDKLPATRRVLAVSAHSMLRGFTGPNEWIGRSALSGEQVELLRSGRAALTDQAGSEPVVLDASYRELLRALAVDGRLAHQELARRTGWSESTVRRRMDHLTDTGVLSYQLEIAPAMLGYHAEARLWMSVRPSALVPVARAMADHDEVSFVAVTTGPSNLVASVICRDSEHLYQYLTERVAVLDAIDRMETAPLIRTVKRNGAPLPV